MLLLDEPLGALDLKLRENMQEELKTLQKSLGITFVFVTHDQGEALSMADRVAVFNDGSIMQIGAPEEIYERPNTRFVADFVGSSNVLPPDFVERHAGQRRWASLRPEKIEIGRRRARRRRHRRVRAASSARPSGSPSRPRARASTSSCRPPRPLPAEGASVALAWAPGDLHLMDEPA